MQSLRNAAQPLGSCGNTADVDNHCFTSLLTMRHGASLSTGVARNWLGAGRGRQSMPFDSHNLLHYRRRVIPPRVRLPKREELCAISLLFLRTYRPGETGLPRAGPVFSPSQQVKTFIIVDAARRPASFSVITGYERRWEAYHAGRYIKGESDDLDARAGKAS